MQLDPRRSDVAIKELQSEVNELQGKVNAIHNQDATILEWKTWSNGTDTVEYRKWSNGYTEVWANVVKASVPCSTAAFGGYRSADLTTNFSTWFKSITYYVGDVQTASGSGYTMHLRTLASDTSLSTMVLNSSSATKTNVRLAYYIYGQSA